VSYNIFLWTNQSLTTLVEFFVFDSLPAYQGCVTDVTEGRDTYASYASGTEDWFTGGPIHRSCLL